ncbi:hypothetical protein UPYG_G00172890 [Umbra pygmaea]|uniref:Uncharacterized protein n=1 Tax=Umbra pygmaea TaxID=75934 RepID=A0ABD0WTP6_UMBPY
MDKTTVFCHRQHLAIESGEKGEEEEWIGRRLKEIEKRKKTKHHANVRHARLLTNEREKQHTYVVTGVDRENVPMDRR